MPTFSTMCLGTRNDADWWRRGLREKLGYSEGKWLKEAEPSAAAIAAVFGLTDNWLYLGGHFSVPFGNWGTWPHSAEKRLYNDLDNVAATPPSREALFRAGHVLLRAKSGSAWNEQTLAIGTGFKQTACSVVLFGGCAIAERKADILAFQALFNKPLILGWKKTTSRQMINLMLGGDGANDAAGSPWSAVNFWTKIGGDFGDPVKVRKAWLATADALFQPGDPYRSHFAVIDDNYVHSLDLAPKPIEDLTV